MASFATSKVHDPCALELIAVKALERGDVSTAFAFADRRCRISPPRTAHTYILRSEALFRLADERAAMADLERSLALDPEHLIGNQRLLNSGNARSQERAAKVLVNAEQGFAELRKAIDVLRARGDCRGFGAIRATDAFIEGWAIWTDEATLQVVVSSADSVSTVSFYPDPDHALSDLGFARSFRFRRPESLDVQHIVVRAGRQTICSATVVSPAGDVVTAAHQIISERATTGDADITVIVPIFEDFAATRLCLECLFDELDADPAYRAILVDDATPNKRIARLLRRSADRPRVDVLTNSYNLGFAGGVNRALRAIPKGDVVLLNADTVPPRGFIGRLAAAARSSPDIGVVMPMSNNGDLASYPAPQEVASLGTRLDVERIDQVAAAVNASRVEDIPNGVGFCLYITRACLRQVGFLSNSFGRGYFEDVEFSLRARAKGFRCVCAPSVYVGHAGSKSFKSERQPLVARNNEILRALYPKYEVEFAAYATADPLRPFREAIGIRLGAVTANTRLVVSGDGVVGAIARRRAQDLNSAGQSVLLINVRRSGSGYRIFVSNPAEEPTLILQFGLSSALDKAAFRDFMGRAREPHVEIFDPMNTPLELMDVFRAFKIPFSIAIADAGLLGRTKAASLVAATRSEFDAHADAHLDERSDAAVAESWRDLVSSANDIIALDEPGRAFGGLLVPNRQIALVTKSGRADRRPAGPPTKSRRRRLGFVPVRRNGQEFQLIRTIVRALKIDDPELEFVVFGVTIDDGALMGIKGVHVTGPVAPDEIMALVDRYAIGFLFLGIAQPLFGHPLVEASFDCRRPLAYFDWSSGAVGATKGDLSLQPSLSLTELVEAISNWMH
jgi:GT2 family glycosyltransferase